MSKKLKDRIGHDAPFDVRLAQPHGFMHCVIDMQREFCDPDYGGRFQAGFKVNTSKIADPVADATAAFRRAGVPTCMVFMRDFDFHTIDVALGGLYKVKNEQGDMVQGKSAVSAFAQTNFAERLRKAGIRTLMVSGVYTDACVHDTVIDALKEQFNVWVLEDCVQVDFPEMRKPETWLARMKEAGAEIKTSEQAMMDLYRLSENFYQRPDTKPQAAPAPL